jgi:hypothetical protein
MHSSSSSSEEENPNFYRFNGWRYGFRGPTASGPDTMVPEAPSFYAFPKDDTVPDTNTTRARAKKNIIHKQREITNLIPILKQNKHK